MLEFIKSVKKNLVIFSLVYVVIGVLLIIGKKESIRAVLAIVAIGSAVAGVINMIKYLMMDVKERYHRNDFLVGAALMVAGVFVYFSNSAIASKGPLLFGLSMILSGFLKLQDLLDSKRVNKNVMTVYCLLALACFGMGVLILADILKTEDLTYLIAGISLIFAGITDLASNIYLAFALADYEDELNKAEEESKEEDIENVEPIVQETPEESTPEPENKDPENI